MRDMKRPGIDLMSGAQPLLNIVSLGRGCGPLTRVQRAHIARTVGRVPEVVVKVSGGARTVRGVQTHLAYVGRDGELEFEMDDGPRPDVVQATSFPKAIVLDWDLDLEDHRRQDGRSIRGTRKPAKLVHNIIFSMPPGTSPDKLVKAVRKFATNEFAVKRRYAFALHTDEP